MIEDRIQKIEARINRSESISPQTRAELVELLAALRNEVSALPTDRTDAAQSAAHFAEASAHEATRTERNPALLRAALEGLTGSVEAFEVSHPQLAATLNRMAVILSNMGI